MIRPINAVPKADVVIKSMCSSGKSMLDGCAKLKNKKAVYDFSMPSGKQVKLWFSEKTNNLIQSEVNTATSSTSKVYKNKPGAPTVEVQRTSINLPTIDAVG